MAERIYISAPEGGAWNLPLDVVEDKLRERWPEAVLRRKHQDFTNTDYLYFSIEVDGQARIGRYWEHQHLTLDDETPQFWADTIAWFLRLLPAGSEAVCFVDSCAPETRPLPLDSSPEQIVHTIQAIYESFNQRNG